MTESELEEWIDMFFDELRETASNECVFLLEKIDEEGRVLTSFRLYAEKWATFDTVWERQNSWFTKGSRVRIIKLTAKDGEQKQKIFVKE